MGIYKVVVDYVCMACMILVHCWGALTGMLFFANMYVTKYITDFFGGLSDWAKNSD